MRPSESKGGLAQLPGRAIIAVTQYTSAACDGTADRSDQSQAACLIEDEGKREKNYST